jgi:methylenetetrahydrofolate--tRNA-(uracil-5-)-methyltransferase
MYNLVGFQTRMKWGEQKRVFRMIPGLENAEFVRFGSMHRNTFLDSPKVLGKDLGLTSDPRILVAGQLTGVEGYVESAAMGQWAGLVASARLKGDPLSIPPEDTALGALLKAITTRPLHGIFAPMNMNFGLLPPMEGVRSKQERRQRMVERARRSFQRWRDRQTWHQSSPSLSASAGI